MTDTQRQLLASKAATLTGTSAERAAAINAETVERIAETFVTERTLAAKLGAVGTATLLYVFYSQGQSAGVDDASAIRALLMRQIFNRLTNDSLGYDIGHPETRAFLDTMATQSSALAPLISQVKAMAVIVEPWPIANGFGRMLDFADVETAVNGAH